MDAMLQDEVLTLEVGNPCEDRNTGVLLEV